MEEDIEPATNRAQPKNDHHRNKYPTLNQGWRQDDISEQRGAEKEKKTVSRKNEGKRHKSGQRREGPNLEERAKEKIWDANFLK